LESNRNGSGLFRCDGCQNSFCAEHVIKHQQDLANQLKTIGQEYNHLRQYINEKSFSHSILDWINEWEQDSIDKIQKAAELARTELRRLDDHRSNELKMTFDKTIEELYSAHQAKNYSEIELTEWTEKLTQFRKEFDTQLNVQAIADEDIPPVYLIKIMQLKSSDTHDDEKEEVNTDRFEIIAGQLSLSDDNHLLTHSGGLFGTFGSVLSLKRYSTSTHVLRFRLESKSSNPIFLGIVSESEPFIPRTCKFPSAYGWRDTNFTVNKGQSTDNSNKIGGRAFQSGDEIVLTLDCDHARLAFMHERTKITGTLEIDLQKCPLPWQIAISMVGMNDRVLLV